MATVASRAGRVAALVCALAGAAVACRSPPQYAVERIVVAETEALAALERAGVSRDAIARAAARALESKREFLPAKDASRAARRFSAQVVIHRAEAIAGGAGRAPAAHVLLTFELFPTDGGVGMRELGRGSEAAGGSAAAMRAALERAAGAALDGAARAFALELSSERKETAELVKDLESGDARVRDHAVRALAERDDRSAVPALVKRLRDPDPGVAERAVGALAQLRDERAVPPLIELARHRDGPFVANLARVVGDIGGADARAWLATLSVGHPDEIVRSAARSALADLEARSPHASVH